MSEIVWKYELQPGVTTIEMPGGSEALTVGAQGDGIFLWARVYPDAPRAARRFHTVGTGHMALALGRYVGTAFLDWMVFHVFEEFAAGARVA